MTHDFYEIVAEKFSFLEKRFGFIVQSESDDNYGMEVIYVNDTTAIKCFYDNSFANFFVFICKLVNDSIVDTPRDILSDTPILSFDLNDLLSKEMKMKPIYKYEADSKYFEEHEGFANYLGDYAHRLEKYGDAILKGDFSVLPEIESKVRARALRYQS